MIVALSILVGILAAGISYRILFYDFSDFWDGCGKFTGLFVRRRWIWPRRNSWPPPPEYFEDEGWSSGIRFTLFLALSIGSGYLIYYELHKHFG